MWGGPLVYVILGFAALVAVGIVVALVAIPVTLRRSRAQGRRHLAGSAAPTGRDQR